MVDPVRHDQFLRLFAANEPSLHAFVRSLVPTRDDAREVMQEVAVVLWRKFDEFAGGEDFRRWAFGVAKFEVLAFIRDKARDRHVFDDGLLATLAEEGARDHDRREARRAALEFCLKQLASRDRELVLQAYAPETRIDRLAAARGQTPMALYKVLHRLRLALIACTRRRLAAEGLA